MMKFFVIIFFVYACSSELDLDYGDKSNKLVVESYLNPDDPFKVRIGLSQLPGESQYNNHKIGDKLAAAKVFILSSTDSIVLRHHGGPGTYNNKVTFLSDSTVRKNEKYRLFVNLDGKHAYASSQVWPGTKIRDVEIEIEEVKEFQPRNQYVNYYEDVLFNVLLKPDFPAETAYYLCYFYIHYQGEKNIDLSGIHLFKTEGNTNKEIRFRQSTRLNYGKNSEIKKYEMTLVRITQVYHEMLEALKERGKGERDIFAPDPVIVPNNIEGGFGIFTSYSKTEFEKSL